MKEVFGRPLWAVLILVLLLAPFSPHVYASGIARDSSCSSYVTANGSTPVSVSCSLNHSANVYVLVLLGSTSAGGGIYSNYPATVSVGGNSLSQIDTQIDDDAGGAIYGGFITASGLDTVSASFTTGNTYPNVLLMLETVAFTGVASTNSYTGETFARTVSTPGIGVSPAAVSITVSSSTPGQMYVQLAAPLVFTQGSITFSSASSGQTIDPSQLCTISGNSLNPPSQAACASIGYEQSNSASVTLSQTFSFTDGGYPYEFEYMSFGLALLPPAGFSGPVLDSGPKSISAGQLGTWIFHYNVAASTPVTNVKVTGITALLAIVNVCVDGTCSGPVASNITLNLAGTSVNVMILNLKFKNEFIWTIGSMNAGTSHIIAITLQGSFTVTGTINVSGPWHASATGTGNTPSTKNLTVNVTWPP